VVDICGYAYRSYVGITDGHSGGFVVFILLVDRVYTHDGAARARDDAVGQVAVCADEDVSWKFTDGDLVRGLLELDDLLILELGFFMDDEIGVHGALVAFVLTWDFLVTTDTWESDALKATFDAQLFGMLAIPALYRKDGGFGGEGGCANDYARDAHQSRYIVRRQITNGDVVDGGVEHKLVLWEVDIWLLRVDYALGALSQRSFEQRDRA